jgi:peptide/nickel transport system substrate-binding protein
MLKSVTRRRVLGTLGASIPLAAMGAMPASAARANILRYATGTDVVTLDPQFVTDVPTSRIVSCIHETLVYPGPNGDIQGLLAESWSVGDDKVSWIFKLRKGVMFHDGTPLDANAVKLTFDRILDKKTGSPRVSATAGITAVDVIDPYSVSIKTASPFAPLLSQLSAYNLAIISPKAMGRLNNAYSKAPSGTGPFKFGSWVPGDRLTLLRNDSYWGEKAKPDQVVMSVVPEDSTRVLLLLSDGADVVANVPPVMVSRLKTTTGVDIIQKTGFRTDFVAMNNAMKPFDDIRVRQAMTYAINTKALLQGVMSNIGTAGGGLTSTMVPGAATIAPYPFDPDKARALLTAAGLPKGFTTDFYVPVGRYTNDRQLGEAIQAQLAEVGITATIKSPEFGTYQALLSEKTKIPFYLLGTGSPTGDPDFSLTNNVASNGQGNYPNYKNPKVDALIEQQRQTVDPDARRAVLRQIYQQVYDDCTWISLFYENQLFGQRSNVKGFEVLPNENVRFVNAVVT